MLKELHLKHVGPAEQFDLELGPRLNILTGDNGLGKTFLLDVAWFALTETWIDQPLFVSPNNISKAMIKSDSVEYHFSRHSQSWPPRSSWFATNPEMLVIYARPNGEFVIWDDAKNVHAAKLALDGNRQTSPTDAQFLFTHEALWNGLERNGKVVCNGLIRDWKDWQYEPDKTPTSPFNLLKQVLKILSPPNEPIKIGKPTRVTIDDVRDIPTIDLGYGLVPVTQVSSAFRRILSFAYCLVWAWNEHEITSRLLGQDPASEIIFLFDELESHLHPAWQRAILPTLLALSDALKGITSTQLIVTTHSPLVLASAEPHFNSETDKLFHLDLARSNWDRPKVKLTETIWTKQGDAVGWLTSDIFGLEQARSKEAEIAIEAAEAWMRGAFDELPKQLDTQGKIHTELLRVLADHDHFWPRWIVKTNQLPA